MTTRKLYGAIHCPNGSNADVEITSGSEAALDRALTILNGHAAMTAALRRALAVLDAAAQPYNHAYTAAAVLRVTLAASGEAFQERPGLRKVAS